MAGVLNWDLQRRSQQWGEHGPFLQSGEEEPWQEDEEKSEEDKEGRSQSAARFTYTYISFFKLIFEQMHFKIKQIVLTKPAARFVLCFVIIFLLFC